MPYANLEKRREYQRLYKKTHRAKVRKWSREWRKRREAEDPAFKARAREIERRWRERNPESVRAKNKIGAQKFKLSIRNSNLRKLYGITHADYERMLVEQGGCCAICGSASPGAHYKFFPVDHDHATDEVRQLLCHACNTGLGRFKDDIELLLKAVAYLKKHRRPLKSIG